MCHHREIILDNYRLSSTPYAIMMGILIIGNITWNYLYDYIIVSTICNFVNTIMIISLLALLICKINIVADRSGNILFSTMTLYGIINSSLCIYFSGEKYSGSTYAMILVFSIFSIIIDFFFVIIICITQSNTNAGANNNQQQQAPQQQIINIIPIENRNEKLQDEKEYSTIREEDIICSICCNKIKIDPLTNLECEHKFHTICIDKWINNNLEKNNQPTCPNCRSVLAKKK
jgi:hypothetical protein